MPTIDLFGISHTYDLTLSPGASAHSSDSLTASLPVLVFVHGWLLSRRYWQPTIDLLSSHFQCLSYDLRGFGESSLVGQAPDVTSTLEGIARTSSRPYGLAAYAEDLAELLEKLHISNAWLVGHSLGGSIALWTAHQQPEQVQGVVCVNAGGGIYLKKEFEQFRSAGQQMLKLRPRWLAQMPLLDQVFARMNVVRAIESRWGRQRLVDFVTAHPEAALGALLDTTTEEAVCGLPSLIAELPQPVHFIAGQNDTIMEPKYVRHLASFHRSFAGSGANITTIPECGHLAMVEYPEKVAHTIAAIVAPSTHTLAPSES